MFLEAMLALAGRDVAGGAYCEGYSSVPILSASDFRCMAPSHKSKKRKRRRGQHVLDPDEGDEDSEDISDTADGSSTAESASASEESFVWDILLDNKKDKLQEPEEKEAKAKAKAAPKAKGAAEAKAKAKPNERLIAEWGEHFAFKELWGHGEQIGVSVECSFHQPSGCQAGINFGIQCLTQEECIKRLKRWAVWGLQFPAKGGTELHTAVRARPFVDRTHIAACRDEIPEHLLATVYAEAWDL